MPRVSRSRSLDVAPETVWRVVADPHHLPRWWPRTIRVEDVTGDGGRRTRFTQVLESNRGNPVRADFRCVAAHEPEHLIWEQDVAGTPFEKFLRSSGVEVVIEPAGGGSKVTLASEQRLRGLSRLGGAMMRNATRRTLSGALDGLAGAVGGES